LPPRPAIATPSLPCVVRRLDVLTVQPGLLTISAAQLARHPPLMSFGQRVMAALYSLAPR